MKLGSRANSLPLLSTPDKNKETKIYIQISSTEMDINTHFITHLSLSLSLHVCASCVCVCVRVACFCESFSVVVIDLFIYLFIFNFLFFLYKEYNNRCIS